MLASSEVIATRSVRLAGAGVSPSPRDRAETTRMVQEKVDASFECASAVGTLAVEQAVRGAGRFWADLWRLNADLAMLVTSRSPAEVMQRYVRSIASAAPAVGHAAVGHWAADAVALSAQGLAPLHRRTAANVKRLRRRAR